MIAGDHAIESQEYSALITSDIRLPKEGASWRKETARAGRERRGHGLVTESPILQAWPGLHCLIHCQELAYCASKKFHTPTGGIHPTVRSSMILLFIRCCMEGGLRICRHVQGTTTTVDPCCESREFSPRNRWKMSSVEAFAC